MKYTSRRRVGMVFQDADSQLFSPVVWEEVAFAPLQLGLTDQEVQKRVNEALSLLGIPHLRNRSLQSLSEGEKRKVALASVLSLGPDVLFLDEPSSDLDPRTKIWLESFLQELHAAGKTIITATHDLELAADTSDRCIVLTEQHGIAGEGLTVEMTIGICFWIRTWFMSMRTDTGKFFILIPTHTQNEISMSLISRRHSGSQSAYRNSLPFMFCGIQPR